MNAICSHLDTIELTELARSAEPGEDWSRRPQQLRADRRERPWHLDWERMTRPGNIDAQFALFRDYANHVARFDELAAYHRAHPPPAHVLGGGATRTSTSTRSSPTTGRSSAWRHTSTTAGTSCWRHTPPSAPS